jgi:hypothetical protein
MINPLCVKVVGFPTGVAFIAATAIMNYGSLLGVMTIIAIVITIRYCRKQRRLEHPLKLLIYFTPRFRPEESAVGRSIGGVDYSGVRLPRYAGEPAGEMPERMRRHFSGLS